MGAFAGKTVIVVGLGKGRTLGFGVADAFAREGANVVLVGRSSSGLKAAARELAVHGVNTLPLCVDFSNEKDAAAAAEEAAIAFGSVDVLVNCTQAAKSGVSIEGLAWTDLELALDTGLKTAFSWMKACHAYLRAFQGCVINFVSQAGMEGKAGQAPLAAAKEAVRALSMVAANEWADAGVRVNCMSAMVRTAQFEQWAKEFPASYEALIEQVGSDKLVTLDEVGKACTKIAAAEESGAVFEVKASEVCRRV